MIEAVSGRMNAMIGLRLCVSDTRMQENASLSFLGHGKKESFLHPVKFFFRTSVGEKKEAALKRERAGRP